MAEAIGVASAVTTLIATAYKSSKTLYYILSGIKNAPRHLHLLSCGLEDLYLVLGTIQAMLDDQESAQGILQSTASENLTNVLQNSLDVLSRISMIVKAYASGGTSMDISTWQRVKWTFKEKEIDDLRKRLLDHKITLNLTISVANLSVNSNQISMPWLT